MASSGFPDLTIVLANIGTVIPDIIQLMQGVIAVMGLYLVIGALIELWGVSHDNAQKYLTSNKKFSAGSALIQLFIGAILTATATLEWMGMMSRALTGTYANSRFISYPAASTSLSDQAAAATLAILGILQIVGLVAMVKGWMTANSVANGSARASMGQAIGWMVGGVLAWNFKWFSDALNNTIGFNVISLFGP
jgi:hypothetical protein